jgi:hypothetical protein
VSAGNPFALVAAAAKGDLEAQRALAHAALLQFYDDQGVPLPGESLTISHGTTLIEGLAFARMAASHGDDNDRNRLVAMLSLGSFLPAECAVPMLAEMIARASMWGEHNALAGDDLEAVDLALNQFAEESPADAVALAPAYRTLIQESEAA